MMHLSISQSSICFHCSNGTHPREIDGSLEREITLAAIKMIYIVSSPRG